MHTFSEHYGLLKIFAIYKIYKQEKTLISDTFLQLFFFSTKYRYIDIPLRVLLNIRKKGVC